MNRRQRYRGELTGLLADPKALEAALLRGSGLPGRRANLELAGALSDLLADAAPAPALRAALVSWASLGQDAAPTNSPEEFLPFCAIQALGACFLAAGASDQALFIDKIRAAGRGPRWRTREAACLALQRIGEGGGAALLGLLESWRPDATLLDLRAALVALAHAPLLERPDVVVRGLALADASLDRLEELSGEDRGREDARVLGKCLAFVVSVYAAADPPRGFQLLQRWADHESVWVKKIVAANLRKARLAKRFPDEVMEIGELLSA